MSKSKTSKARSPRAKSGRGGAAKTSSEVLAFLRDSAALQGLYERDRIFRQRVDEALSASSEHTQPWARQLGLPDHADETAVLAALTARLTGGSRGAGAPRKAPNTGARRGRPAGGRPAVSDDKLAGEIEKRLRSAGGAGLRAEALSLPFRAIKPAYKRELEKLLSAKRISKRGDRRTTTYTWIG